MSVYLAIGILVLVTYFGNKFYDIHADAKQRKKMKKRELELSRERITPAGSTLSHGMYVDENDELVADEKETLAWYKQLT